MGDWDSAAHGLNRRRLFNGTMSRPRRNCILNRGRAVLNHFRRYIRCLAMIAILCHSTDRAQMIAALHSTKQGEPDPGICKDDALSKGESGLLPLAPSD